AAGARNVISGNVGIGVRIVDNGTTGNVVLGNYIGTNSTGMAALGNGAEGVVISGGDGTANTVGGLTTEARNVISATRDNGISIFSTGETANVVQGNYIGTDAAGTSALGNASHGVFVYASNALIGGTSPAARNLISGNGGSGVRIEGPNSIGNQVQGNF